MNATTNQPSVNQLEESSSQIFNFGKALLDCEVESSVSFLFAIVIICTGMLGQSHVY